MGLAREQVEAYHREGYLVLPRLFDRDTLARFDERFLSIVKGDVPLSGAMKIMQDVMVVKGAVQPQSPAHAVNKLLCLEDDDELFAFVRNPKLVSAVQSLIGDEIYSLASNVFNKPPGVDGRHPMHQDLRYFKLQPADRIVGVWTAMLPATRESGCLAVLPRSHERGMLEHGDPDWEYVNFGFFGVDPGIDFCGRIHVELQPGDTLLFHPLLVHGSGRNRSEGFRRAISAHYASSECESPKGDWRLNPQTRRVTT
jgi:phytanoyl-CoA hydroxylase